MPNGFPQLKIGNIEINPPVVLAPMAGVTNPPFRRLCRRFGAGLYVSEMITARALVEKNSKTLHLATFDPEEQPRSIQLYGVDPDYIARAVRYLVSENRVDHIDLNFGCPVRKVTRKGGGAAIPAKPNLLRAILRAAISSSGGIPVTMKFRIGIDENITTYLDAGRIGEDEGCAAIALHARTAAQLYDGEAQWSAIAKLKKTVTSIPVLGNGNSRIIFRRSKACSKESFALVKGVDIRFQLRRKYVALEQSSYSVHVFCCLNIRRGWFLCGSILESVYGHPGNDLRAEARDNISVVFLQKMDIFPQ